MQSSPQRKIWHIIIGGTIGNLTEWYNFLLYGFLAPTISKLFFPAQNQLMSLTLTFTVFALSFFVRPFGGILFGWIGDTYGRQRALMFSLLMMSIPTLLIGLLPTYQSIGVISPILLCLFRICQGLSAGGEHTGSAVYVAECAPINRRALWVSTIPASAALGVLFSSTVALFIMNHFPEDQLLAWGWRTGYWAGALFCFVSLLLRITMPETPYFQKNQNKSHHRYPLSTLIKDASKLKSLLIVIGLASSWSIFYQILFIWMPTYLIHFQHYNKNIALQLVSLFIFCLAFLIVTVGYFADYINRKLILTFSCITMLLFSYPLFTMLSSGFLLQVYVAMAIFTLIFSLFLPTAFVTMVELFNSDIRYTGLSFGFNLGLAIFGGTCPLIATWLIEITGDSASPAFYMILSAICALLTLRYIDEKETKSETDT